MIPMDWICGLLGGLMIGTAAAIYLLGDGRIMGASGVIAGLWQSVGSVVWQGRALFIAGVVVVPGLAAYLAGGADTHATINPLLLIVAGLLVGYGTRLGNGCTSGHGVCGMSRLSPRGIAATATFVGTGVIVMFIARHVLGVI
ncbi:YeeE/YedE family protein [Palleronia pontilimi]|uniref:YeeE/YedE family protein n=1 Tax=Palleronia pontilimi TaxID=1964209 RepID=UPI001BE3EE1D|nr:YeeE/YedE thiosulfate transporter family protein [Palleronia pontilimi]